VRRSLPLLIGVAGVLVALDQWAKHWASAHLAYREPVRVIGDLVRLTYARNSGIAFSLLAGRGFPLYIFSLIAALAVFVIFLRHERMSWPRQLSLAMILGGAVGNLIDRVSTGQVGDFILLSWRTHEFPVFNVADMAVTGGVTLFALVWTHEDGSAALATSAPDEAVPDGAPGEPPAPSTEPFASGIGTHEQDGGADGAGTGSGAAGGPLAREGADRPVA
jgi:signal peptidase II